MPTEASFRFSTYLALALACVAVGYAEAPLLPEVAAFAALAVVGLGVLYFLESRVAFLSIPAANRLGMAVGLLYLMWAAYRVKREIDTAEFINMGWHMLFVAMCGPLVMLAVVAKSARSDKHAGDYWGMHGIALAGVGLSAALAEEPICFLIVGLYLCATVWSLALLHLCRARGIVPPIPGGTQPATKAVAVSTDPTGHRTELRPALACAFAALAFAVPFYLLTPRSTASKADFGKPRMEIGYSADQMVDLNRTGALSTNPEPAFEVTAAHRDGTPKTDLNREQRWRGKVLRHYALGEWKTGEQGLPPIDPRPLAVTEWVPPDLGPGQYELRFEVPAKLRASFLADPVLWAGNQPPPLAVLGDGPPRRWLPLSDGSFFWEPDPARPRGEPRTYVQHTAPPARPDAGPPFRFIGPAQTAAVRSLIANPVARAKEFADAALRELDATKGKDWPRDWRDPRTLLPKPEHHDTVARALGAHLAARRDLQYTTDLARTNKLVDPIEDFLFHSKAGHCERFATALALMLRSQEIPAVMILGFKGCEHTAGGKYVVRQEHAHAWVEALVPVPGTDPRNPEYHWLSLDPTPGGGTAGPRGEAGLFSRAKAWASDTFREYLADYTPQQRKETLKRLAARALQPEAIATIASAFVLLVGAWKALRRKPAIPDDAPDAERWFGELSALLAAHGIRPAPGDTALEFARAATDALRAKPNCAAVAEVPLEWAAAYYAKRFGGEPITETRRAELDARLAALRQALKG